MHLYSSYVLISVLFRKTQAFQQWLSLLIRLFYLSINRSFVHSFVRSFICSFVRSFVHLFFCSFVHLFICSFVRSFFHSFFRSFVHLFFCSFVRSFSFFQFIHIPVYSVYRLSMFIFPIKGTYLMVGLFSSNPYTSSRRIPYNSTMQIQPQPITHNHPVANTESNTTIPSHNTGSSIQFTNTSTL